MIRSSATILCCLLLSILCRLALAQTPHGIWQDPNNSTYKYVWLDPITGNKTIVANLPPITGFVAGDASASNINQHYYYFIAQTNTNKILYTLDYNTGTVINNPVITNTVVGIEYNCADSTLYGIQVVGNAYYFAKIDPVTATTTTLSALAGMQGYVGGTFSLDIAHQVYSFRMLTSTIFKLRSINVQTGAVLYDNPFPNNVVGHKYSPTDDAVYGMWDNGGTYQLEKIDYTTGAHTTVNTYTAIVPGYVTESASMNQAGEYTFMGFYQNNNYALFTLDATTGSIIHSANTSDNAVGFEEPSCATVSTTIDVYTPNTEPLYPNPACENLFTTGGNVRLELYDVLGKLVLDQVFHDRGTPVAVALLPAGIYTAVLHDERGSRTVKVVIAR